MSAATRQRRPYAARVPIDVRRDQLLTALADRQQVRIVGRSLQAVPDSYDDADPIGCVTIAIERLVAVLHEDPVLGTLWRG